MSDSAVIKLIVIAPNWLQPSLAILLEAEEGILLLATFKSVGAYLSFGIRPHVVLLFTEREDHLAPEQVKRVLSAASGTKCIVVVHDFNHREAIEASGASEVLATGAGSKQIIESIRRVAVGDTH